MAQGSNTIGSRADSSVLQAMAGAATGALGWTVRCTPRRRTVTVEIPGERTCYVKIRRERGRRARVEWRWLRQLGESGFRVPEPLGLQCVRGHSLLCTGPAPGRPMDALLLEALTGDAALAAVRYAVEVVAPMVRRLHDRGLFFRDLYWNHLFAASLDPAAGEPCLIDVERVIAPRFRAARWRIKDLAGLLSSLPAPVPPRATLRFLRRYLGDGWPAGARELISAVANKAARIVRHVPKFG